VRISQNNAMVVHMIISLTPGSTAWRNHKISELRVRVNVVFNELNRMVLYMFYRAAVLDLVVYYFNMAFIESLML